MRVVRLACLLAVLLALAGCASAAQPGSPPSHGTGTSDSGTATAPPVSAGNSPSGSGQLPGPAPSDSDGLQVSGPVPVSLLSRSGPLQPAGPYLGRTLSGLLGHYRAGAGGAPACLPAGCWSDAQVPGGALLLGVRPAPVACYQVLSMHTARPAPAAVQLDLQLSYTCRPGAGSAARMAGWLLSLPVPATPGLSVTVRVSLRPGTGFSTLSTATL